MKLTCKHVYEQTNASKFINGNRLPQGSRTWHGQMVRLVPKRFLLCFPTKKAKHGMRIFVLPGHKLFFHIIRAGEEGDGKHLGAPITQKTYCILPHKILHYPVTPLTREQKIEMCRINKLGLSKKVVINLNLVTLSL